MKTVALIPVRGGSKSIPGKNIKLLAGKPLLHYALEAALGTSAIDEVYVSSDSEEILEVARAVKSQKLRVLSRPMELATDNASTESVMLHFAENHSFDRVVLIQATSPLTTPHELDAALEVMRSLSADSLVSVTREHRFIWREDEGPFGTPMNYRPESRPRRQDWPGELFENGAFYVSSRTLLLQTGCRLHGKVVPFVMSPRTAIELDTPGDWDLLEALLLRDRTGSALPAPQIDLIVSDVDGVLTDAGMYYGPSGDALKKFNTKDGMGIRLWREAGHRFAVITGENSPAVAERMKKLQVVDYYPGVDDKLSVLLRLTEKYGVPLERTAFIGDDVNDLAAMKAVALPACPRDAHASVRAIAKHQCDAVGGGGCVRDVVDWLLGGPTRRH